MRINSRNEDSVCSHESILTSHAAWNYVVQRQENKMSSDCVQIHSIWQTSKVTFFKFTKLVTDVLKAQDVTNYVEESVLLITRDNIIVKIIVRQKKHD